MLLGSFFAIVNFGDNAPVIVIVVIFFTGMWVIKIRDLILSAGYAGSFVLQL